MSNAISLYLSFSSSTRKMVLYVPDAYFATPTMAAYDREFTAVYIYFQGRKKARTPSRPSNSPRSPTTGYKYKVTDS
jgi:hypothetical protein